MVLTLLGFDGAIHMSEEVRNSAITIPRVLILTIVINGAMAFGFLLTILFCIGNVENALGTPTGFPIIEIFYQATGSKTSATIMETCVLVIGFAASFGNIASVSRLTWAFARDGGLPFSKFFSFVSVTRKVNLEHDKLISLSPRSTPPIVSLYVQLASWPP
jgi:choline transport protein